MTKDTITREQWLGALEKGEHVAISTCDLRGNAYFARSVVFRTTPKYVILACVAAEKSQSDGRKFLRVNGSEVGHSSCKICPIDAEVKRSWQRAGAEVKRSWQRAGLMRRIDEICSAITSERINLHKLSDERLKQLDELFAMLRTEAGK